MDCVATWDSDVAMIPYLRQLWSLAMCFSVSFAWFALLPMIGALACQRENLAIALGEFILAVGGPNLLVWNVVGTVSGALEFTDFCIKKTDCDSDLFVLAMRVCAWVVLYCLALVCCYAIFLIVRAHVRERRLQKRVKTWRKAVLQDFGEILMESNAEATCAICLDGYKKGEKATTLPECKHQFHTECVEIWLERNATCPVCRRLADESLRDYELSSR